MTGNAFDPGDKVGAVREGGSYLTLAAFCKSYYAHLRYPTLCFRSVLRIYYRAVNQLQNIRGISDCQEHTQIPF